MLSIRNLRVEFPGEPAPAVDDVSITVEPGKIIGIVGESGSGKSMTLSACLGLVPQPGRITAGSIRLGEREVVGMDDRQLRELRGKEMSLVPQNPMTSLHPSVQIGKQLLNVIHDHAESGRRQESVSQAVEALEMVGVPNAKSRLTAYPHQLSGGLRQRVIIAMAIVNRPRVLLADEPTTALDVTVQARILTLLRELNEQSGITVVLVTHNFGVVAGVCDDTVVMREGKVIEAGSTLSVFAAPSHRYTRALLDAVPRIDQPRPAGRPRRLRDGTLFRCAHLMRTFESTPLFGERTAIHAMQDICLDVEPGEALGLVGESGAGKTTLARTMIRLDEPTSGRLWFESQEITHAGGKELRPFRRRVQMVFQDPYSSLDPRWTVERIVAEPLLFHGLCTPTQARARVEEVLDRVHLSRRLIDRRPRQLSGGECQRVAIARAIAVDPDVIVADEPVSALDVSIQAQIMQLFAELREKLGLTLIIVAHDLGLVHAMCDRVAVMRDGKVLELGDTNQVFRDPQHAYTRVLLRAAPSPDPVRARAALREVDRQAVVALESNSGGDDAL